MKNKTTNSLPANVKCNKCSLKADKREICPAFNKHFAAAGHSFSYVYIGPTPIKSACINPVNHTSQLTLQPISPSDAQKSTGTDKLNPLFLKLSTPL